MWREFINQNMIARKYWILFGVILILSFVTIKMMRLIEKASKSCEGPFVDTLSLNIKEHENFNEFNQGMCEDQTIKRYSRDDDQKFPFIARLVAKHQQDEIFCGGSLITSKFILKKHVFKNR